jgi:hypothetical protein
MPKPRTHADTHDYAASISILRGGIDPQRTEQIGAVIGAYGRLQDSVRRFLLRLATTRGAVSPMTGSFDELLTALLEHARAVGFVRMQELENVIDAARMAERERDIVFADPWSDNVASLRTAAAKLERLDKTFVGLCVDYVVRANAQCI